MIVQSLYLGVVPPVSGPQERLERRRRVGGAREGEVVGLTGRKSEAGQDIEERGAAGGEIVDLPGVFRAVGAGQGEAGLAGGHRQGLPAHVQREPAVGRALERQAGLSVRARDREIVARLQRARHEGNVEGDHGAARVGAGGVAGVQHAGLRRRRDTGRGEGGRRFPAVVSGHPGAIDRGPGRASLAAAPAAGGQDDANAETHAREKIAHRRRVSPRREARYLARTRLQYPRAGSYRLASGRPERKRSRLSANSAAVRW